MPKYEIMLILDPKEDIKIANTIAKDAFGSSFSGFEKMDRTELAYPINNSTTATYLLSEFEADSKGVAEFTRKVNITKSIWRQLIINLSEEKSNKVPRPRKPRFSKSDKFKKEVPKKPEFSKTKKDFKQKEGISK